MHEAHETSYAGQTFRSRLEAKWAAFFDLVGWKWTYEPLDLKGWVPDFLISAYRPILVEVKPFLEPDEEIVADTKRKIEKAYHGENEILILGAAVGWQTAFASLPALGLIGCPCGLWHERRQPDEAWWEWENAASQCQGKDFCADISSYAHRISGIYDGDGHMVHTSHDELQNLWRKAANVVRWLPKTTGA